jgi:hypothetical protein
VIKRWIFVFGLAACGGSPKPAPAPAPEPAPVPVPAPVASAASSECIGAVNNMVVVMADQLRAQPPKVQALVPQITQIMTTHCSDDKWAPATLQCMATVKTGAEQTKCEAMLTPDQAQKVTSELDALIQTANQ